LGENSQVLVLTDNESMQNTDLINDSYEISENSILDESLINVSNVESNGNDNDEPWSDLKQLRNDNPKNLIFGTLNVNSIRNKFQCLKDALTDDLIDILTVCESKLDASFPKAQFHVDGFSVFRQDSSSTSGGVMVYMRSDIPCRRRYEYEFSCHEYQSVCLEFSIRKEKWFLLSH
jgi:hypothetical protein